MAKIITPTSNLTWYRAHLKLNAEGLFTTAFYPPKARGTKSQELMIGLREDGTANSTVVLAPRLTEAYFRIVTAPLAASILTVYRKATKAQMLILNRNFSLPYKDWRLAD